MYQRALAIFESELGEDAAEVAVILSYRAQLHREIGRDEEAAAFEARVAEIEAQQA